LMEYTKVMPPTMRDFMKKLVEISFSVSENQYAAVAFLSEGKPGNSHATLNKEILITY